MEEPIQLLRDFFDSELWDKKRVFSQAEAMLDLIQLAASDDRLEEVRGKTLEIFRGELVGSRRKLGKRWGWSSMKASRFISVQISLHRISERTIQGENVLKLLQFGSYGIRVLFDDTRKTERNVTRTVHQRYTNDTVEDKPKRKKPAAIVYSDGFMAFWAAYPPRNGVRSGKADAFKIWRRDKLEQKTEVIVAKVNELKGTDSWQRDAGQYIPMPSTFLNGKRWEDEVVDQSDLFKATPVEDAAPVNWREIQADWAHSEADGNEEYESKLVSEASSGWHKLPKWMKVAIRNHQK